MPEYDTEDLMSLTNKHEKIKKSITQPNVQTETDNNFIKNISVKRPSFNTISLR